MNGRLSLVYAACLLALGGPLAQPAVAASDDADRPETVPVRLLAVNDFHGNLEPPPGSTGTAIDEQGVRVPAGGAAFLATHLARSRDPNTLTVAQGDLIGGSPLISAAFHDEPAVDFLGRVGVTAAAVGNHEFNDGAAELLRIQDGGCHPADGCSPAGRWPGARFRYLAANVLRNERPILPAYTIRRINGVRIGFIGVVTRTTPTLVGSDGIKGLDFAGEVVAADRAAAALRARGVRSMVLLVHEGDTTPAGQRPDDCGVAVGAGSAIAANADPDIDMVLAGHTHQQYVCTVTDPSGGRRLYTQGLSFSRVFTQVDFRVDRRTGDVVRDSERADNHVVTRDVPPDPKIEQFVETWRERVAPIASRPVGRITQSLTRELSPTGEMTLGDVIADSQLAGLADKGGQIAFMNPGGVRTDLPFKGDGTVTYGDAFLVLPFSNVVGQVTMTGGQIKALLEQQWQPQPAGPPIERILLPSANLHYTMDRSKPIGDRISGVTVDGQALDEAKPYKVVANSFLLGGNDGFTMFTEGTGRVDGPTDTDAFVSYLGAHIPLAPPALDRIAGS